jgi:hypothetical protein
MRCRARRPGSHRLSQQKADQLRRIHLKLKCVAQCFAEVARPARVCVESEQRLAVIGAPMMHEGRGCLCRGCCAKRASNPSITATIIRRAVEVAVSGSRLKEMILTLESSSLIMGKGSGLISYRIFLRDSDRAIVLQRGKRKGLGLGLSIVKHLVELHNGTVSVESKGQDQGATFIVTLPLLRVEYLSSQQWIDPATPDTPLLNGYTRLDYR